MYSLSLQNLVFFLLVRPLQSGMPEGKPYTMLVLSDVTDGVSWENDAGLCH